MIRSALTISLPILFGFVPLGIAFGLLFQELGYPWYFASLMAIFVYAGAAQFMAIGLLSSGIGLLEIAISTFFLNSRHMFYGLAFLESFGNWNLRKLYLTFFYHTDHFFIKNSNTILLYRCFVISFNLKFFEVFY